MRARQSGLSTMHGWNMAGWFTLGCLILGGCSWVPTWVPFAAETPDRLPGVLAPHEKIAALKKLAQEAPARSADEKQRVVRDLVRSLPGEKDPIIRAQLITTLAEYPGNEADEMLLRAVKDPDRDVQVAACKAWARRGGPHATEALRDALNKGNDEFVRLAAARALGASRDPAAVTALGTVLEDSSPALQYRAMLSLQESTGKDFGNDVNAWRQYVKGETPQRNPATLAERVKQTF